MAALILAGAVLFVLLIFLSAAVKVAREYERGVVFRLGRLIDLKGPGIFFILPFGIDRLTMVLTGRKTIREVVLFPALRD